MEAIFLYLYRNEGILKQLQIKMILNKSDSSTAVQDISKQRAGELLVGKVKKIVILCQQLKIQIQTQHVQGKSNNIANALCRLSTQGDYSVKKEIFQTFYQVCRIIPTLDLYATGENKLVDRFLAAEEGEEQVEAEWINAFMKPLKNEIFWIHIQIPKIGKAMAAWNRFKLTSILIAPRWPGQILFTYLQVDSSRYPILGENSLILNPENEIMKRKVMLKPGKIVAFLMDKESNKKETINRVFEQRACQDIHYR
ncbi:MAG: hypothetical protein EZS28_019662 [Streblomastix strix]|uniref:Uncharacterized protein n=1 Tax=Streblomastix strix TaxID=222440 RepID=A0A5J4VR84_9EUKA|nr:MAG: hypothetical protein EZS28_019662 [Streblomastix strix]